MNRKIWESTSIMILVIFACILTVGAIAFIPGNGSSVEAAAAAITPTPRATPAATPTATPATTPTATPAITPAATPTALRTPTPTPYTITEVRYDVSSVTNITSTSATVNVSIRVYSLGSTRPTFSIGVAYWETANPSVKMYTDSTLISYPYPSGVSKTLTGLKPSTSYTCSSSVATLTFTTLP